MRYDYIDIWTQLAQCRSTSSRPTLVASKTRRGTVTVRRRTTTTRMTMMSRTRSMRRNKTLLKRSSSKRLPAIMSKIAKSPSRTSPPSPRPSHPNCLHRSHQSSYPPATTRRRSSSSKRRKRTMTMSRKSSRASKRCPRRPPKSARMLTSYRRKMRCRRPSEKFSSSNS